MPRIGVCDDSEEFSLRISAIVKDSFDKLGGNFTVMSFTDGDSLMEENRLSPFDALFLDIDMPRVGGFDIAKSLREDFSECLIVFVTSHAELVFDSLDFQPFNFVRKGSGVPLEESIPKIVNKLAFHLKQDEILLIEDKTSGKTPVKIRDIVSMESSGHYIVYSILRHGEIFKITSRGSVSDTQKYFENYNFIRVHKGFLVNFSHVKYLNSGKREIELSGGIKVPIGKLYRSEIEEKYRIFLRRKS